jgi:hypothetical protein
VKNLLLLLASVVVTVALLELGLRALTPFPVHWRSHQVPDPILRWVMDPSHEEIDAAGARLGVLFIPTKQSVFHP